MIFCQVLLPCRTAVTGPASAPASTADTSTTYRTVTSGRMTEDRIPVRR
ncbi:MAG: hypothetical protein H6545_00345 [Bacteroidales bacterium]|nr:hypothetical protein [Bacteroidales bacterium]